MSAEDKYEYTRHDGECPTCGQEFWVERVDQLVAALEDMMEWARSVSDEYIDGGDLRNEYRQSLKDARAALAAAGEKP